MRGRSPREAVVEVSAKGRALTRVSFGGAKDVNEAFQRHFFSPSKFMLWRKMVGVFLLKIGTENQLIQNKFHVICCVNYVIWP